MALRVTFGPNSAGYAWCADASVIPGPPADRGAPQPATEVPAAVPADTRALDEVFARGL
jgi:hypothetical protein